MRVGVIATMKKGLELFVYRELLFFTRQGISLTIFPTKFQTGTYNARPDWRLIRWKIPLVLLMQPAYFLQNPSLYTYLLKEAIHYGAVIDFLLGWYCASKMKDVDIIYATFGDHKLFVGYFCKRILNKPLVVTIHAYELYANPNPHLFERALNACDQVITVTEYNREFLHEHRVIESTRVEVVRCGLDIEEYRPESKFIILIVGFFVDRKGHDVLLKAVKKLGQEDIEIWIVGDEGTESDSVDVRGLVAEMGLQSQVAFFGKLSGNALKAVYRTCDVFCLPSRKDLNGVSEGFPVVLMEAMAMGKPVITTRHVEIPRVVEEILIEENDVEGLVDALRQVRQSPELRERQGRRNREIAQKTFSSQNAAKTTAIFHRIASARERNEG
jgi:colanic acid/amylovoran biosynthesis glycosyltransferase